MKLTSSVYDYVFLSDPDFSATYLLEWSGRVRLYAEGVGSTLPQERRDETLPSLFHVKDFLPGKYARSWREGWLPILDLTTDSGHSLSLFCYQDELWVHGENISRSYPSGQTLSEEQWQQGVEKIIKYWHTWLQSGLILPDLHPHLDAAWRSSLVQARCAFRGRQPKYGVEKYAEFRADAFPPTIISMCHALHQFAHHSEARQLAEYYLQRFVRADGSLDYYGTALSEYGELLQMCAELAGSPDGERWLKQQLPVVKKILFYLYDRFNPWMHRVSETGLCYGSPEADTRDDQGVYLHNNLQLCRGLLCILPWLKKLAEPEIYMEAYNITSLLQLRLQKVLEDCRNRFPFLPYRLEQTKAITSFRDCLDHAYANYRYYPEMLAAGLLPVEESCKIVLAREQLQGEHLGMTVLAWPGSEPGFDHWPLAHYGRALLELDDRSRFMKILFSHLLYYQSPDTHSAYESITWAGDVRHARSDWCVPAQLVLPRLLAWSFQYRCWDGCCRNWQGPSQKEIHKYLGKKLP